MKAKIHKILYQVFCVKALLSKNRGLGRCVAKEKAEAKVLNHEAICKREALQRKDLKSFVERSEDYLSTTYDRHQMHKYA